MWVVERIGHIHRLLGRVDRRTGRTSSPPEQAARPGPDYGKPVRVWEGVERWRQSLAVPLPPGRLSRLSRQAREFLFWERAVLDGRHPAEGIFERPFPAVSPSAVLTEPREVEWLPDLLGRLYRESLDEDARAEDIRQALENATQELAAELSRPGSPWAEADVAEVRSVLAQDLKVMRHRARQRATSGEMERSADDLVTRLRLTSAIHLLFRTERGRLLLHEWAESGDDDVRQAWRECGRDHEIPAVDLSDTDCSASPSIDSAVISGPAELAGRRLYCSLMLWCDTSGPVGNRPPPARLATAPNIGRFLELAEKLFRRETRRASFPAGLADRNLRIRWFWAVLLLCSHWESNRVRQAARMAPAESHADSLRTAYVQAIRLAETTAATRPVDDRELPDRLDRIRVAALLQRKATVAALVAAFEVDNDGWETELGDEVFRDCAAFRHAVPLEFADWAATIDPVGTTLPTRFGHDQKNRAARFGTVSLDQIITATIEQAARKCHQHLLKHDQGDSEAALSAAVAPRNWHAFLRAQVRHSALDVARKFESRRPVGFLEAQPEPVAESEPPTAIPTAMIDRNAARRHPELLPLLATDEHGPQALADLIAAWNHRFGSTAGKRQRGRLRWLTLFRYWWPIELAAGRRPHEMAMDERQPPLRRAMHAFVLTGQHRPNEPSPDRSTATATSVAGRDSKLMYQAVQEMIRQLYPDIQGPTEGTAHGR